MGEAIVARIVVYDVAADSGGALLILMDYYTRALEDDDNEYLFVIGSPELRESSNVKVYRAPEVKRSWVDRVLFDVFKAHTIIEKFGTDNIISLQNMVVPLTHKKQTVYMHNLLPKQICDLRFSLFEEPKMWVYQNIIGQIIISSLRKADEVIVQTHWLARRCSKRCGIPLEKIRVERPGVVISVPPEIGQRSNCIVFFYPASAATFKNHAVIFEACKVLDEKGVDGYEVVFTLKGDENARIAVLKAEAERLALPIRFVGWLGEKEMVQTYAQSSCLLFPSKLETLGLPLEEAKAFGLRIVASDLEYAHETIGEYEDVAFFDPCDAEDLANAIEASVRLVIGRANSRDC
jgi:glycosyltransferase involved in cell wall biosynthesis